mgnify:CR=1 FL=1
MFRHETFMSTSRLHFTRRPSESLQRDNYPLEPRNVARSFATVPFKLAAAPL